MAMHSSDRAVDKGRSKSGSPSLRDKVHARACELASIAGRSDCQITQLDYEQAKRDLTGEADTDLQNEILDHVDLPGRASKPAKSESSLSARMDQE